jgi:uncharacterized protein (TIGR02145 family)
MRNELVIRAENFQPQPAKRIIRPLLAATLGLAITLTLSCSSGDDPPNGGGKGTPVTYEGETYETVVIGTQTWMAKNLNYKAEGSKCYGEGGQVRVGYDKENHRKITITLSDDEIQANCAKYGRLYNWAAAMDIDVKYDRELWGGNDVKHKGICPSGWHIPTNAEWDALYRYVDGTSGTSSPYSSAIAGKYLKAASGWSGFNTCDDYDTECEPVTQSGNGEDKYGFSALPGGLCVGNPDEDDIDFIDAGSVGGWWSTSEGNVKTYDAYYRLIYNDEGIYWLNGKSRLFSVRCVKND